MPQINKPTDYFNTKLYTGTGANQSITGVGHQPDLVWIKDRTNTNNHVWTDSVRGVEKVLLSNATNAETTYTDGLVAFTSDGFNLGDDDDGQMNVSGNACVSWNWKAGGTASSNTDGSITSTVSANTTSGFSIVTYSGNGIGGATVGHGLNSALGLIILKCRDTAGTSWQMFHKSLGATKSINLESTSAAFASTAYWNDTAPTSSVFSLGTGGDFNNGSRTYVAYCFAEKKGFSKFGSYTGNGNANGTFVYTGMRPAFVIIKSTNLVDSWFMQDTTRDTYNPADLRLEPNGSGAEGTSANFAVDYLSNGFKIRANHSQTNNSGTNYIYMAFAESPLVGTNNIPATAR